MTLTSPVKRFSKWTSDTKSSGAVVSLQRGMTRLLVVADRSPPGPPRRLADAAMGRHSSARYDGAMPCCSHSELNPLSNIQPVKVVLVMQCLWQPTSILAAVGYDTGCRLLHWGHAEACLWLNVVTRWADYSSSPRGSRRRHGSVSLSILCPTTDGPSGVDAAGKNTAWPLTVVTCWSNVRSEEISTPSKRALSVALIVSLSNPYSWAGMRRYGALGTDPDYVRLVWIHLESTSGHPLVYDSNASFHLGDGVGCVWRLASCNSWVSSAYTCVCWYQSQQLCPWVQLNCVQHKDQGTQDWALRDRTR